MTEWSVTRIMENVIAKGSGRETYTFPSYRKDYWPVERWTEIYTRCAFVTSERNKRYVIGVEAIAYRV